MKNGGIYGGWDQSDHQAFLKVRHICLFPATEWSILKYVVAREQSSIDLPSICLILQIWTKHSGNPAYKKEVRLYLPGKTLEEIEQHEEWQQKLIHLQEIKKEVKKTRELTIVGSCQKNLLSLRVSLLTIFRLFSGGGQASTGKFRSRYRVRMKQKEGRRRPRTRSSNTSESVV